VDARADRVQQHLARRGQFTADDHQLGVEDVHDR
jgi:hypothetical protein